MEIFFYFLTHDDNQNIFANMCSVLEMFLNDKYTLSPSSLGKSIISTLILYLGLEIRILCSARNLCTEI